ncbi:restriction endonuclease subunit S [Acinetobacter indicus]|uniref:Type I restriction modification DNA specificity domain-containing protein n=1 Tax=Acinetobacter indicus CIP 110367 TaxID=1341679 RepID=V2UFH4_9GAMM|nr:restriction endonuclease subunit S [Acinetobacter indicus]EPF72468.1 type I restriction enzyme, S subunit [Acinetobacter indicus ANC 4215]ESK48937.1 hypothetical protein P253_01597 [Acinetobacter indicus CIP 110367]
MFNKYDAYKDSGIDWVGKIPASWDVKRLKAPLAERNEKNDPIKTDFILSLTMHQGVIPQSEKTGGGNKPKEDLTAYKLARPNDIVLNSMNVIVGSVGLSKYFGVVSPVYYMLYARDGAHTNIGYYNYIFQSQAFQKNLGRLGTGILIKKSETSGKLNTIRMKISMDDLNNELLPIPSFFEQNKIVEFLDRKTTEIDQAIAIKEQQIALLNERKQIVIQKAVTQGLNPNVPMKDSGVEWIGRIPEHWLYEPIKYSLKGIVDCEHKTAPFVDEKEFFVIRTSNVKNGKLVYDDAKYTHEKGYNEWTRRGVPTPGDVLLTREAPAGEACLVPSNQKICLGQRMVWLKINNKRVLSQFILYLIYSNVVRTYIDFLSAGSTVLHFNMADIKNIPVLIPPLVEQKSIIQYLDKIESDINHSIEIIKLQIAKLKEYKTTLINDAVTGKIKVA